MATLIERGLSMVTVWQPAHEKGSKPNIPKLNSSTTTYQLYFAGVEGWRGWGCLGLSLSLSLLICNVGTVIGYNRTIVTTGGSSGQFLSTVVSIQEALEEL